MVVEMCSEDEVCRDLECVTDLQEEITTSQNIGGETSAGNGPESSTGGNTNERSSGNNNGGNTAPPRYVFDGTIIKVKFQIEESLERGMIDVGLCGGVPADGGIPTFCNVALFLRVENAGGQLLGTLYLTDENDEPQPIEGGTLTLNEGEIYDLVFLRQTGFEEQEEMPLTVTLDGSSFGSTFQLGVTSAAEVFASFGLWNYRTDGGPENALSGTVVGVEISRGTEIELSLLDFLEFSATEEFTWDVNQSTEIASFYVTNEKQSSALFPLSVLEGE